MNAIRALLRQARAELGIVQLLGECVLIPSALIIGLAIAAGAGVIHG